MFRLIDSVRKALERQLARRREQTGLEPQSGEYIFAGNPDGPKPIRPGWLSDRLANVSGHSNVTLQDLIPQASVWGCPSRFEKAFVYWAFVSSRL